MFDPSKPNVGRKKYGNMNDAEATRLRAHVAALSEAAEARIRNEQGADERLRRATQAVQVAGMGEGEYWVSLLYQVCPLSAMS